MLRYIIGITLITIGIITVRAIANGKILKKHQYAIWLLIPVCMILLPFLNINVQVAKENEIVLPEINETVEFYAPGNKALVVQVEDEPNVQTINNNATAIDKEIIVGNQAYEEQEIISEGRKTKGNLDWRSFLLYVDSSVSAILVILLIAYNTGFMIYCRHKREYVGKDSRSGLKIYRIKNKGTPFLLFNNIYVDKDSAELNEYVICHEACHYKHGDYIWVLIRYLVLFLNWYNPVVWAAFILSGRDSELACDEEVLRICGTDSSAGYVETLLGLLRKRSDMPFGFSVSTGMRDGYKTMKKRIKSIKYPAKKSYKALALCLATVLAISSCAFIKPENVRKISEDDPWFDTNIVEVKTGAESRITGNIYNEYIGSDDQYYVFYTGGHYVTTEEEENSADFYYNDHNFYFVSVVDKDSTQTVNTIDLKKDLARYENPQNTYYSNGIITVQSDSKVRDYDPLTGELLDTRNGRDFDIGTVSRRYKVGEYEIETLMSWPETGRSYCTLEINDPDGNTSEIEIKDFDKNVYVYAVLEISDTKAVLPASIANKTVYYELDLPTAGLSEGSEKDYEWLDSVYYSRAVAGTDGMVYYNTGHGIFRLDAANKRAEEVLLFNWCDLNKGLIENFNLVECSEDRFVLFGTYDETNVYDGKKGDTANLIEITKAGKNPHAGKTVLELYDRFGVDKYTGEAIRTFNQSNGKYYIEITDRYKYSDFYDGNFDDNNDDVAALSGINGRAKLSSKLAIDIMNGEGPDILMNVSDLEQLNNPESLADLSPYVKDFSSDRYFTNIVEGSKTDGVLYQLPISFGVEGILAKTKDVSSYGNGFTFDEYTRFVDEAANGKDPIIYGQAVYFAMLFSGMSDKFISNGKVDLSGPEFKALADYIKDNVREEGISWNAWYQSTMSDGPQPNAFLAWGDGVDGIADYYSEGMMIATSGKGVSLLGIPSVDGRGPRFAPTCSVAVSAKTVDKKACGEFIKILLSDEIQTKIALNDHFVISREAFEKAGLVAIEYFNNGGGTSTGSRVRSDFTTEDIDFIENMILGCSEIKNEDSDISIILIEEMPPYFLGQKDLDSVIKIAEDRIQKVLDERA